MPWLAEHWRALSGGGLIALLLVLWRSGFIRWIVAGVRTIRKAYRDQQRADAVQRCSELEKAIESIRVALRVQVETDDARDEIHQQDLTDKKQMAACIARLKDRLTKSNIPFDDLL